MNDSRVEQWRRNDGRFGFGRAPADRHVASNRVAALADADHMADLAGVAPAGWKPQTERSVDDIEPGTYGFQDRIVNDRRVTAVEHSDGSFTYDEWGDAAANQSYLTVMPSRLRKRLGLAPKVRPATSDEADAVRSVRRDEQAINRQRYEAAGFDEVRDGIVDQRSVGRTNPGAGSTGPRSHNDPT